MNVARQDRIVGIFSLFLLVLIWGALSIFPKYLSQYMPVLQQLYLRLTIATILSLLFFVRHLRWSVMRRLPVREWLLIAARSFCYYSVGAVLYNYALQLTTVANSSFVSALPFTAAIGFIFFKEKVTRAKLLWVGLSVVGVFVLYASQLRLGLTGLGEVYSFFSGLAISVAMITRRSQSKGITDREASVLMLGFASIFIATHSLLKGDGLPTFDWPATVFGVLFVGGLLVAGMSFVMNYGFSHVEPALANNILTLDAPTAAIFGLLFFKEVPTATDLIGAAIILLSVFGLQREEQKRHVQT